MKKNIGEFFAGVKEIEYKNKGGCLFFCYAFWKYLKKNGLPTESFEIVQYAYEENSIEHNIDWINKGNVEHPISSYHFTWLYNGVEYDATGKLDPKNWPHTGREVLRGLNGITNLVEEFCVEALTKCDNWNFIFKRGPAIEIIQENLGIDMSDVGYDTYEEQTEEEEFEESFLRFLYLVN